MKIDIFQFEQDKKVTENYMKIDIIERLKTRSEASMPVGKTTKSAIPWSLINPSND